MTKVFEEVQAWVDSKIVVKMKIFQNSDIKTLPDLPITTNDTKLSIYYS